MLNWPSPQIEPPVSNFGPMATLHPYLALNLRAAHLLELAQGCYRKTRNTGTRCCTTRPVCSWKGLHDRTRVINNWARIVSESCCSRWWEIYRTERQAGRRSSQPVTWDDWGQDNLTRSKDLTRAQSTLLLQCRTGVGGFGAYLFRCKVCSSNKQNRISN